MSHLRTHIPILLTESASKMKSSRRKNHQTVSSVLNQQTQESDGRSHCLLTDFPQMMRTVYDSSNLTFHLWPRVVYMSHIPVDKVYLFYMFTVMVMNTCDAWCCVVYTVVTPVFIKWTGQRQAISPMGYFYVFLTMTILKFFYFVLPIHRCVIALYIILSTFPSP